MRQSGADKRKGVIQPCADLVRFGENLRAMRRHRGLSIRQVHERTGLSETYLSHVERALANISIQNMSILAAAVGSSVAELVQLPK